MSVRVGVVCHSYPTGGKRWHSCPLFCSYRRDGCNLGFVFPYGCYVMLNPGDVYSVPAGCANTILDCGIVSFFV